MLIRDLSWQVVVNENRDLRCRTGHCHLDLVQSYPVGREDRRRDWKMEM